MQINWFTVIAQILNFLVLVWLMKRYLYKPILDAIDQREKKIKGELADAKTQKAEAKSEKDEFNKKNEVFDQQKKEMMDKAVADANEQRQKLLEEAKNDAAVLQAKLENTLKEEQADLNHKIAQKTGEEVFAITRKALADIAGLSFEEQAVNVFIKRLNALKDAEKEQFIKAFKSDSNPLLVRTAFKLADKQQTDIKNAVAKMLGDKTHFDFKITSEIIGGIEISTKGYKLAWSISEYVNSFEKSIAEVKKEKPTAGSAKKHHAVK